MGFGSRKSAEIERFGIYLRYGIRLPEEDDEQESKFNPYHDPDDGRFTFAPGGTLPPRNRSSDAVGMTARVQRQMAAAGPAYRGPMRGQPRQQSQPPARSRYPSALSAKYESGDRGDPGAISSVPGDPGGRSYGSHQLASRSKMVDAFVASPEASRWAVDFRGLKPVTPQFDAKWKQIAVRDPAAFGAAQENFVGRTNYDPVVRSVVGATGLNLDGASEAVRQATYSTAIQHAGARDILKDAVQQADGQSKRSDPSYQRLLVTAIYDQRATYVARLRNAARGKGNMQGARVFDRLILNRYPNERADALRLPGIR
jgi:hypothetical protein